MKSRHDKMVSICMITFNHEPYIAKAIEGVLSQSTDFDFDLIIGEDFSQDNTRTICERFYNKHPQSIRLLESNKNLGMIPNFIRTIKECHGKYIALCEGDDYWTDPFKLQKQVDFLENHPEYSLSCHLVKILNEETKEVSLFGDNFIIDNKNRDISVNDFLDPFLIITCSLVFRRSSLNIANRIEAHFKDIALFADLLSNGKGILLKDCMAVYRQHAGGIWSNTTNLMKCKANAYTLIEMNKYYKYKISHIKTNASLQISDYLILLIAEKEKNIIEKSKVFLTLLLHYREDVGKKQLVKLLKKILKSIV